MIASVSLDHDKYDVLDAIAYRGKAPYPLVRAVATARTTLLRWSRVASMMHTLAYKSEWGVCASI